MSLASAVAFANLSYCTRVQNRETGEVRDVPIYAAVGVHGRKCNCEKCAAHHMQVSRDPRKHAMRGMNPGNVDQGNRGMGGKKLKAADYGLPSPKVKQVAPPKGNVQKIKPSQLMHEKGMLLPNKHGKVDK